MAPGPPTFAFLFFNLEGRQMQNPTIPDNHGPLTGTIAWIDAENNPTSPAADEDPTITSDNEAVATAEIADDKTTVTVTPTGQLGTAVITVDVTNESGQTLTASGTVTVEASDATSVAIDFTP